MFKELISMLHLPVSPVGIYFSNTTIPSDSEPSPEKRNCVIPQLMAASKGKVISMTEESCNCAGGATGCCFGDGFKRHNPNIHKLLSQGFGENAPEGMPRQLVEGERFYCDEETALKFVSSLPYSDRAYPRIVFAPVERWEEFGEPDLVYIFADADRISAIIALLSSHNGRPYNTIAPMLAACQSIMVSAAEMDKDDPMAVMGLFDISQRYAALKDQLSITMPYSLFKGLTRDLDKSCLTSISWKKIEKRLIDEE